MKTLIVSISLLSLGFILLIANYLSPIIVGILTMNRSKTTFSMKELPKNNTNMNFGSALKSAPGSR